jgi:hypothetical protein
VPEAMKTNKAVQLQIAEAVTTKVDCPTKKVSSLETKQQTYIKLNLEVRSY